MFLKTPKGWNKRHLNQFAVMRELLAAQRKGYMLTVEQSVFWEDTISLFKLYNKDKTMADFWAKVEEA